MLLITYQKLPFQPKSIDWPLVSMVIDVLGLFWYIKLSTATSTVPTMDNATILFLAIDVASGRKASADPPEEFRKV